MKRILVTVALVALIACGVKLSDLPPIAVVIPAPAPPANTTPAMPTPDPPPVVEPTPPAPAPVPLQNLNILVLDAAASPVPGGYCVVNGDRRLADGRGFINFAIAQPAFADCAAPGFLVRHVELPPGDHRVHLDAIPAPPQPAPVPNAPPASAPAPGALCATRASDPIGCVRQVAATYAELLTINTFESCVEFTQRVLEVFGPDYGHVGKTASEGQSVPKGFTPIDAIGSDGKTYRITGVSHDAIKHRVTGQVIDLLGNATANEPCHLAPAECWKPGPASIQWTLIPPQFWRAENPFIPAVPVR